MTYTLNSNGKSLLLDVPVVMGILNYTEDSFYDGSRLHSDADAILRAEQMLSAGADIIDIGAQSTRPGSVRLSSSEEIDKLKKIIPMLRKITDKWISVDTYHAEVAGFAVGEGVDIINDISGGTMDEKMIKTVGQLNVPYICMHIKGTPENMQQHTDYEDILLEITGYFADRLEKCRISGIKDVIIDPGFGLFAKTIDQNLFLLKHLAAFKIFDRPVLAGLSRKSTIYKTLNIDPSEALNGTTVLNTLAIRNGAQILRVHDVREAKEVITLAGRYMKV